MQNFAYNAKTAARKFSNINGLRILAEGMGFEPT